MIYDTIVLFENFVAIMFNLLAQNIERSFFPQKIDIPMSLDISLKIDISPIRRADFHLVSFTFIIHDD